MMRRNRRFQSLNNWLSSMQPKSLESRKRPKKPPNIMQKKRREKELPMKSIVGNKKKLL